MIESTVLWVAETLGVSAELVRRLLGTLAVLAAYVVARRVTMRFLGRRFEDSSTRYRFNKGSQLLFLIVGCAVLFRVWFQAASGFGTWLGQVLERVRQRDRDPRRDQAASGFGTWLGLVSAGVAVALTDPLENLAGWLYFVMRRPFRVGDRIQVGDHAGDVIDVHLFSFTLLEIGNWVDADQSTGRLVHIPNGWMFKHSIAGYDQGFPYIWNEIAVTVTFESDWRVAKRALEEILEAKAEKVDDAQFHRASEMLHIQFTRLTPVVWVSMASEGVKLTMRYLCAPRARRVSTSQIWEAILDVFDEVADIDFAYPTMRRFDHAHEGKPALRATAEAMRAPRASHLPPLPRSATEVPASTSTSDDVEPTEPKPG